MGFPRAVLHVGGAHRIAHRDSELGMASMLRRCSEIASVAARRSMRTLWRIGTMKRRPQSIDRAGVVADELRLALEDLGPTFVKLGQLLAARSDLASPQMQRELSKLRDHAPSIPSADLLAELERGLGSHARLLFATLEMAPAACGSMAQVHRGTLHDGTRVAVKVRRPGVVAEIESDIRLLRLVFRSATFVSSRARAYDPVALLDEFADLLRAETNFVNEASSLDVIGRTFANSEAVTIPRVITTLSSEGVLVMDWIEGVPLSDRQRLARTNAKQVVLARTILRAYGVMIFQADRFHADPHPGNLIAIDGQRLGLIDFGEVGSVEPADRLVLLQVMAAVLSGDGDTLATALLSIGRTTRPVEPTEFGPQLSRLLEPVADAHMQDVNLGETLRGLLHLLRQNGVVLPSTLAVLIKTIIECETTIDELDPNLSMRNIVSEFGVLG